MMSRLRAIIITIVIGMYMGGAMQAYAYEFMDEARFTKRGGYDPIPIKKGEKVLASPKGYPVSSVVFILSAPYEQVVKELKSVATEKFGKFSVEEKRVNEEPLSNDYSEEMTKRLIAKLTKFRALNINIEDFRESIFTTRQYNIIDDKTYSVLLVRIADGQDIFGVACTLVFLSRTDTWLDWYREFHTNIPIPWKGLASSDLITDTEVGFIENLKVKMHIDSAYFFPFDRDSPFAAELMMLKIKETIDESNKSKNGK